MDILSLKANAADRTKDTLEPSGRGGLTLKTTIIRRGTSSPYTYHAYTKGTWQNSAKSGENHPAPGNDFVMQSCPTVTSSSSFSSTYNYSTSGSKNGQNKKNFFYKDGGPSWIEVEVVDDPIGLAQLSSFTLTQTFKAKATSTTKKIYSYYIHTWKSLDITVSASGSAGLSGETPSVGVTLQYTPSIKNNDWKVYNYVSYDW